MHNTYVMNVCVCVCVCVVLSKVIYIYICCVIQEPEINSQSSEGLKPEKLESDIVFDDIHFNYPARPDVPVRYHIPPVYKKSFKGENFCSFCGFCSTAKVFRQIFH